jgi:hypothetical protein
MRGVRALSERCIDIWLSEVERVAMFIESDKAFSGSEADAQMVKGPREQGVEKASRGSGEALVCSMTPVAGAKI